MLCLVTLFPAFNYAQEGNKALVDNTYAKDQMEIRNDWDNFRERDASIFKFNFVMPEDYIAGFKKERDSKFFSGVKSQISLSYYAKYSVFKITEEILSEKTGKKVIVADPDLVQNKLGMSPGTNSMMYGDKGGFDDFPYWTKKSFLKYDHSVGNIIELSVELTENFIKPVCKISLTIYDEKGKKIKTYKHKKKFRKVAKSTTKSKHYGLLTNSIWEKETFSGVPIPTIIDIYIQTLEEMLTEQNFTF